MHKWPLTKSQMFKKISSPRLITGLKSELLVYLIWCMVCIGQCSHLFTTCMKALPYSLFSVIPWAVAVSRWPFSSRSSVQLLSSGFQAKCHGVARYGHRVRRTNKEVSQATMLACCARWRKTERWAVEVRNGALVERLIDFVIKDTNNTNYFFLKKVPCYADS